SLNTLNIFVGSREDGIKITMDGTTKAIDSDEVIYQQGGRTKILIGSCSMEMSGSTASVDVSWDFRGTYSDVPLEQVTASGTVTR
ncbi:MAG: hypothetical protein CW335_08470, partial [Clostridiales bacterium]|nr:hypothetical protein [Clostridiales bacterium]